MLGPRQERHSKLFYTGASIEERLDAHHPLRKIAATVDFAFVRSEVAALYGVRGNPSLDPTLVLKLLFLLFYENVSSERELLRQLPCRLDWLWFLSMDLDSAIPDHSVLSKARKRWGSRVFTGFFQKVLGQCVAAGLVDGARVHVDGSLIEAAADAGKLALALQLTGEALYGQLEAGGEQAAIPAGTPAAAAIVPTAPSASPAPGAAPDGVTCVDPSAATVLPTSAPSSDETFGTTSAEACVPAAAAESPLSSYGSPTMVQDVAPVMVQEAALAMVQEATPACPPASVPPGTLYSPTDPEARLTRKYGRCVLGYKDHRVVDDRCGIITATLTTAASVDEGSMLEAVMDQHEANTGRSIIEPTADKGYGTVDNYRMLRERQCTPVIPHPRVREDKTKFPRSRFIYDPGRDVYHCPAGQCMRRRGAASDDRYHYKTDSGVCESCPLHDQCTAGKVRGLTRQVHQDAIDWADSRLSPGQRKARMRQRKIRAEGSFADAANHHGYKRARWRGRDKVTIQNLLIACIQNLRKLVRHGPKAKGPTAGHQALPPNRASNLQATHGRSGLRSALQASRNRSHRKFARPRPATVWLRRERDHMRIGFAKSD
jgi:transposase